MSADTIAFWGASLVPGAFSFALNWALRGVNVLKSSGADWLLLLFGLDLTAILTAKDFVKFVPNPDVQANLTLAAIISAALTVVLWVVVVRQLEPILEAPTPAFSAKKISAFVVVWVLVIGLSAAHVFTFLYK